MEGAGRAFVTHAPFPIIKTTNPQNDIFSLSIFKRCPILDTVFFDCQFFLDVFTNALFAS